MTSSDPTRSRDRWQPLRELLAAIDAEIEDVYNARGLHGVRPRYAYPLIRLAHTGPLTIRELAESLGRTHSAISQTLAGMRREGLIDSEPGTDARTRRITLTERGRALVPFLEAEWRATEEAVAQLDDEVMPHALSQAVTATAQALRQRSMKDRISEQIGDAMPPPPPGQPGAEQGEAGDTTGEQNSTDGTSRPGPGGST
ncbi:MarR family winged helix-turn-helix transcriptional regulator [Pseudonocardia sp. RS010]|uniref:MarR family winged helix-turn-helix transcriptional regulator n=1 Tax=Pseudonocardia sp. RS010 TaxID=3385979 RepID=UPI0039A04A22